MILKNRFSLAYQFLIVFVILSFVVRLILMVLSGANVDLNIIHFVKIFAIGAYFDVVVAVYFVLLYSVFLLIVPSRWIGSLMDRVITYSMIILMLFIVLFGMIAEFPFWAEFNTRFNFIAVDYLIYTYEVLGNINQSYPLPLIIAILVSGVAGIIFYFRRQEIFKCIFAEKMRWTHRLMFAAPIWIFTLFFLKWTNNQQAEWSSNSYENELSKNGIYSFFAAYNSNELDYNTFYSRQDDSLIYPILRQELLQSNQKFIDTSVFPISRIVEGGSEKKLNIVLITIESFSADFLKRFGNQQNLCPNFDKLQQEGILFTNMYATGTRTVRGMEALTLCVPPTPGNSIVRRPDNQNIFSLASILEVKNYAKEFIYGGDGYFDNMNTFFGGQGFDIIDRDRGHLLADELHTRRIPIKDKDVSFENAWGICDEDIYNQALQSADRHSAKGELFFQFIMTCSNHRPFTFPEHKIALKQGTREAAVMYTDFALGCFLDSARRKPWFNQTVFVIVADHCASSAGKWELNIDKHHIPALILNLSDHRGIEVDKLCSQIDLMPSLLGFLKWNYRSAWYGKDISLMKKDEERALIGNYRTLGLLKDNVFSVINDRKKIIQYNWDQLSGNLTPLDSPSKHLEKLTISYFQTASNRFKNGDMKEIKN